MEKTNQYKDEISPSDERLPNMDNAPEDIDPPFENQPEAVLGIELDEEPEETPPSAIGFKTDYRGEGIQEKLDSIKEHLDELSYGFKKRLQNDTTKDKIIEALHEELREYKNNLIKKQFESTILDLINFIDAIKKMANHYRQKGAAESDPAKLMELIETIPTDMEDIFQLHHIEPFTCPETTFNPAQQKILRKIETDDKQKERTIARRLRSGYKWEGKIIRPEIVEVYVFKEASPEKSI